MQDFVYHGRLERLHIGFSFAATPDLANEAVVRHNCDPLSAHVFTRALNAGVLCMHSLHAGDKLNLHWRYPGALKDVVVDLRADGRIRGLISPTNLSDFTDRREDIYGEGGHLNVVHGRGPRILNSGTVTCDLQHITRDLGYYFSLSAQQETELNNLVAFTQDPAAPVSLCQGMILQALPDCDLNQFGRIRDRMHTDIFRELLSRSPADGLFEELLNALVSPEGVTPDIVVQEGPGPKWFCTCGEDKFKLSLRMLPEADRADVLAKGEPLVVRCEFCNQRFAFSPEEAAAEWARG